MLPRPHHAVGGRKLELTLGIYASSVRPPSDNDLGPYRNWQTVLQEAPRGRPTRSPLTPHRAPDDSATAAGEQLSTSVLQWRCNLGLSMRCQWTASAGEVQQVGRCFAVFMILAPAPSVRSACSLVSPIWAYIIVAWWLDGWSRPKSTPTPSHPQHGGVRSSQHV